MAKSVYQSKKLSKPTSLNIKEASYDASFCVLTITNPCAIITRSLFVNHKVTTKGETHDQCKDQREKRDGTQPRRRTYRWPPGLLSRCLGRQCLGFLHPVLRIRFRGIQAHRDQQRSSRNQEVLSENLDSLAQSHLGNHKHDLSLPLPQHSNRHLRPVRHVCFDEQFRQWTCPQPS